MAKRKSQDYVARRRTTSADDTSATLSEVKWWTSETGLDAASKLWTWVDKLRAQSAMDGVADLIHEAIYADEPIARGGMFDGRTWQGGKGESGTCILNAIKSLVDTASARLTKVRSMPVISADDASYTEKRFARKVSRVLRRKMGSEAIEEMQPQIIRDFCIRGSGVNIVERCEGDTTTKRAPIYEIVYDRREASFTFPRSIAHVRPELRDVLVAKYPKYAQAINDATLFTRMDAWMQFVYQGPQLADLVEVAESWHLPSSANADDGQHIVCIRGTCVLREPWRIPRYPVVFSYWTAPQRGVRGKGLVSEHAAAQELINGVLNDARTAIKLASQLKIFVPRGANMNKNHLRATDPVAVEVDGAPGQIQWVAPDPVSKQAWAIAFQIMSKMYDISGIPEWQAQGKKPLGNQVSGKAMDTMDDIVSDRFAQVETLYQQSRVALGRAHVDLARMMYDAQSGKREFDEQPAPIPRKELASWIRDNRWDKVDIDSGDYHLTLEPENFITGTRGGRLEDVAEAAKAGLIPDPTMTASLFDEPDIERMNRPTLGPIRRIESCMEKLADVEVDYMLCAPDPYMNLPLAKLMAKGELEQAMADDAPDAVCQRFRDFLADIKTQEDNAAAGSPSLAGAQANTIVAQPNAATLQPGAGAPPMPGPGPGMAPGGPMPPSPGMS